VEDLILRGRLFIAAAAGISALLISCCCWLQVHQLQEHSWPNISSASTLVPSTQWRLHYQHSVSSFLMSNNCLATFCVRRRRPHLWNVCFHRAAFWCIQTEQECRTLFWKRLSFCSATSHIFKSLAACCVLLQLTCHQDGLITLKIMAIWSLQIITEKVNKKSVRTEWRIGLQTNWNHDIYSSHLV